MKRLEPVTVLLPQDEDEPQHPELGSPGDVMDIDPNDPRLVTEKIWCDPAADAYATSVTLIVAMDMRGLMASSISVKW
jgi:hypothetical protein